jgi:hypothetical protein
MQQNGLVSGTIVFVGILCNSPAIAALPSGSFVETQAITLDAAWQFEDFGYSLAADGEMFISGAINSKSATGLDVGASYVYGRSSNGTWDQLTKLIPNDGGHNDAFGAGVGIDGDFAIVGAWGHSHPSSGEGAAYIFQRGSDAEWQEVAEFPAAPGSEYFGTHVDVAGGHAVASGTHRNNPAPGPRGRRGFVSVFEPTGPLSWTQTQRIDIGNPLSFVHDVAIGGGTLIVGTSQQATVVETPVHAVEIFEDSAGGFIPTATLSPLFPQASRFGFSVALDGDRLLVGDPIEAMHGAAYIYERNAIGNWERVARLTASNFSERYHFGSQVALHGDLALINSWVGPANISDGLVYVFQRNAEGEWVEIDQLRPDESDPSFGESLALVDGQLLVGAGLNNPGAVHVFSAVPEPTVMSYLALLIALVLGIRPSTSCLRNATRS